MSKRIQNFLETLGTLRDKSDANREAIDKELHQFWSSFVEAEKLLKNLIKDNNYATGNGQIEIGSVLYLLNYEMYSLAIKAMLLSLHMPHSTITKKEWHQFTAIAQHGSGLVAEDGTILLNDKYASLDREWVDSLFDYLIFKFHTKSIADFGKTPAKYIVPNQDTVSIALIGNWGTGDYLEAHFSNKQIPSPSTLVGNAVKKLEPDITIHLGNVFYAGKKSEEKKKLLKNFPTGKLASFTLNSNHEMYCGANGYFKVALKNDSPFSIQNGTSYFSIHFKNWVIIGLDTAYYDNSALYKEGTLSDREQLNFIKSLKINNNQKVVVLTHHAALSFDGKLPNNGKKSGLFAQVYKALGNRYPDYWYYGQLHNGIVYNDQSIGGRYKCPSNCSAQFRCVGHSGLPFGKAWGLLKKDDKTLINGISYFAHSPIITHEKETPEILKNRVMNGFAMLTLKDTNIVEQFYEVSISKSTIAWTSVGIA